MNRKLALIPAILLLALCIPAVKWGLADLNAYTTRHEVSKWESENRLPVPEELTKARVAIETALNWSRAPEYYDYLGRLHHYNALISDNPLLKSTALQEALVSYRHSNSLRPQWPYTQANIALIKAKSGEFDQEYQHMIRQSVSSGPWENGVNIALTEAGLLGWLSLNMDERKMIIDNIRRGIRRNPDHIKVILNRYNKRSLICANLQRDVYQRKLCGV
ncbi:hypothetical protein [uncultured Amphritea sp.]|uniref:hypothetical protein n=1 Tax=uncultured Amphritea sp. TaxID=981605 RepID=UPI002628FDD3|nr:hypothetical protein [uncultured Amphritea sp.]